MCFNCREKGAEDSPSAGTSAPGLDSMNFTPDPPQGGRSEFYTSLWDFKAMTETELSFRAGDVFQVLEAKGEWWWAKKTDAAGRTLEEGYVPYNYLAKQETMEAEP